MIQTRTIRLARVGVLALVMLAVSHAVPATDQAGGAPSRAPAAPKGGLLVSSRGSHEVLRFAADGAPAGLFAADPDLQRPVGLTFGPDGNLYVAVGDTDRVMKFDGKTGRSLGIFVDGGLLRSPRNLNFGPDGALYVADGVLDQILRFDGKTGAFDRVFVEGGGLNGPTSFTFGPDGNIYVVSVLTNRVLRFDGQTGEPLGEFAATALTAPHDVSFGPDGDLYVTNSGSRFIQRYRGDTGEHLGAFVDDSALINALGMAWGPGGNLYVANQGGDEVRVYDRLSGESLGSLVAPSAGGLSLPSFLAFERAAKLTLAISPAADPGARLVEVSGARPGARVLLVRGSPGGASKLPGCPKLRLALRSASVDQVRVADESGNSVAVIAMPSGVKASVVAVDASRCLATKPVALKLLANPR